MTDRNGWTPVVEFYLSRYGGDEFTIHATEDSSYRGGMSAGPYTVWRKFWYQVTEMQQPEGGGVYELPAAVKSAFESAYSAVYMRFEEQEPRRRSRHADNLVADSARRAHVRPFFRADDLVPFKLHIATIDYASEISERRVTATMRNPLYQTPDTYWLWMRGGGTHPWKVRARYRRTGDLVWHCRRRSPACPGHTSPSHRCDHVEGAVWDCGERNCPGHTSPSHRCPEGVWHCHRRRPACPGHSSPRHKCENVEGAVWDCGERNCPGHRSPRDRCARDWQDIPDDRLSVVPAPSARGWKAIRVDFTHGPERVSGTNPVEIELVFRHCAFVALGWGGGSSAIFLCMGTTLDSYTGTTADQRLSSILTHEGGHALGLVNMPPSPAHAHDAWETHDNHCDRPPSECVMWYQITADSGTDFHLAGDGTGCHDALRRQDYSRGSMGHWSRT